MGSLIKMICGAGHNNWIASKSVDFPLHFRRKSELSPQIYRDIRETMPINQLQSGQFLHLLIFLSYNCPLVVYTLDILYPHCHQDGIIDQNSGLLIFQIRIQQLNQLISPEQTECISHRRLIDHFVTDLQA